MSYISMFSRYATVRREEDFLGNPQLDVRHAHINQWVNHV